MSCTSSILVKPTRRKINGMKQAWGEADFREYVRQRIDKHFYTTAGEITLGSWYVDPMPGYRFDKLLSIATDEIRLYKQKLLK